MLTSNTHSSDVTSPAVAVTSAEPAGLIDIGEERKGEGEEGTELQSKGQNAENAARNELSKNMLLLLLLCCKFRSLSVVACSKLFSQYIRYLICKINTAINSEIR